MRELLKLMIDTTVIVETLKENTDAKEIFKEILDSRRKALFYINPFVVNEVVFILTVYLSELSPKTLKKKKEIVKKVVREEIKEKILPFIEKFFICVDFNLEQNKMTYELCEKYGLLPTDAAILATCKYYGIPYLISLDEDFCEACEKEGIGLIDSVEKLKGVF